MSLALAEPPILNTAIGRITVGGLTNSYDLRQFNGAVPKPAKRIVDKKNLGGGRDKCAGEDKCRHPQCNRRISSGDVIDPQHLVKKGDGGDDVDANIIPLCRVHHEVMDNGSWQQREVIGYELRPTLSRREILYVRGKRGPGYFNRRFPERI